MPRNFETYTEEELNDFMCARLSYAYLPNERLDRDGLIAHLHEYFTCEICCQFEPDEVGLSTGYDGTQCRVCVACDVDGYKYNGWGGEPKEESDNEETESDNESLH